MQPHGSSGWDDIIWALVPVKELALTKQRLRPCLGIDRAGLSLAMIKDLLQALAECRELSRVAIVTADDQIRDLGLSRGAYVIDEEESTDLNLALELGRKKVREEGADRLAIFPADLPLASGPEIDRLIRELRASYGYPDDKIVGICPSRDRGGTNFLCIDSRLDLAFAYGPDSFERHRKMALALGCQVVTLASHTLSLDIDHRSDLDELVSLCQSNPRFRQSETWNYLARSDYIEKSEAQGTKQP